MILPVVAVLLVTGATALGQDKSSDEAADSAYKNEPMSLNYRADEPAEMSETTTETVTEAPAYDILTTKRLTGNWGGLRTWMDDNAIDLSIIYTGSWQQNFRGGLNTHNANDFNGDLRFNLYMDLDKMGLVPGGFFFVRGKSSYNDSVRSEVGSLGSPAWVFAGGDEEFYCDKWWYGQYFFDKKLEFRIGKLLTPVDLFDKNDYAQSPWDQFLNQYLCANPTFPHRKAPGAFLKYQPCDFFYIQMAGLNADQRDSTRALSFDTTFHNKYGERNPNFIGMWEFGMQPKFKSAKGDLPGNYRFGWWYDARPQTIFRNNLGGLLNDRTHGSDIGFYASFDQMLWKEVDDPKDKQGLGAFFRYGYAHRDINAISNFWSLGASYKGPIPKRDKDVLAFGVAQSIMSSQMRHEVNNLADRETIYELYYAVQVTPWLILTPDLQVITNPGGNKDARDAIVGSIRARISL
jgi:porin